MGGATPGLVLLDWGVRASKTGISVPSWALHQFLLQGSRPLASFPSGMECAVQVFAEIAPASCFWSWYLIPAVETLMLQPFNTAPHVVVTPNHKIIFVATS